MFSKSLIVRVVKSWDSVEKGNSLPSDKFLDFTKFKAFADNKSAVAKIVISQQDRVKKNSVGKVDNAGYHHFLLFSYCFEKASFSRLLKSWD